MSAATLDIGWIVTVSILQWNGNICFPSKTSPMSNAKLLIAVLYDTQTMQHLCIWLSTSYAKSLMILCSFTNNNIKLALNLLQYLPMCSFLAYKHSGKKRCSQSMQIQYFAWIQPTAQMPTSLRLSPALFLMSLAKVRNNQWKFGHYKPYTSALID